MLLFVTGQSLFAQTSKKKDDKKTDKYAELIEDAIHKPGFIDTYQTDEKLYLAVEPEMIGKDFLMNFEIVQGIGASGLYGGTMLNIF